MIMKAFTIISSALVAMTLASCSSESVDAVLPPDPVKKAENFKRLRVVADEIRTRALSDKSSFVVFNNSSIDSHIRYVLYDKTGYGNTPSNFTVIGSDADLSHGDIRNPDDNRDLYIAGSGREGVYFPGDAVIDIPIDATANDPWIFLWADCGFRGGTMTDGSPVYSIDRENMKVGYSESFINSISGDNARGRLIENIEFYSTDAYYAWLRLSDIEDGDRIFLKRPYMQIDAITGEYTLHPPVGTAGANMAYFGTYYGYADGLDDGVSDEGIMKSRLGLSYDDVDKYPVAYCFAEDRVEYREGLRYLFDYIPGQTTDKDGNTVDYAQWCFDYNGDKKAYCGLWRLFVPRSDSQEAIAKMTFAKSDHISTGSTPANTKTVNVTLPALGQNSRVVVSNYAGKMGFILDPEWVKTETTDPDPDPGTDPIPGTDPEPGTDKRDDKTYYITVYMKGTPDTSYPDTSGTVVM